MPGRIDQNRPFLLVNIAILTVFDTRDASQDRSGDTLADLVTSTGDRERRRRSAACVLNVAVPPADRVERS
jgi:molybdopterin biosynthesis enzyme MoaB